MEFPSRQLVKLLVEHDPASPEFRAGVREAVHTRAAEPSGIELNLWKDVFVEQPLPWGRMAESALLHGCVLVLVWVVTQAWLRKQEMLAPPAFDRSSVITYSPEEYLPPLDTGETEAKPHVGDPAFAKQPILSVPREADNRSQTIVAPPELKLSHDVPLPNIVAMGAVAPTIPLNAISSLSRRDSSRVGDDPQVVAPAPELANVRDHITQAALRSQIIPPPPQVNNDHGARGLAEPETAVVAAPPELTTAKGRVGQIDISASEVVAPAPQLAVAEQHALYGRGHAGKDSLAGNAQAVAPAPSVAGGGGGRAAGRLVALEIHPVAPTGPVAVPQGNRRGSFGAGPQGKRGASGAPDAAGVNSAEDGSGTKRRTGTLPEGLHVGAAPGTVDSVAREGLTSGSDPRSPTANRDTAGRLKATTISDEKMNDLDRQVFGDRRPYGTTLNMPNLNSSTGSWVMHFAELEPDPKQGDLLQPLPTGMTDPGYPLELMRENVQGTVTVYAVIHADGRVDGIRVLNSPDDRLDVWATRALAGWKFMPALRDGKPVGVEAVVQIPFRAKRF